MVEVAERNEKRRKHTKGRVVFDEVETVSSDAIGGNRVGENVGSIRLNPRWTRQKNKPPERLGFADGLLGFESTITLQQNDD